MVLRQRRVGVCGLVAIAALLGAAAPVSGQYFGRQKVQYEDFNWWVMETDHFDIHYYPEEEELTRDAARMSERWYARLSRAFQHEFKKKPIVFYSDHPDFQQTNTTYGMLTEGTGGFTDALRNRVVMPFTGSYFENDHVLGHEIVHVFQYDLASSAGGGGLQGLNTLPLWLIEGMAEYLSLGRDDAHTAMWMRDAALRGELPTIVQLTRDQRFFPYRYGQALWAYVAGRFGDQAVTEVFRYATRAGFDVALQRVVGLTHEQLSQDWITSIRATYLPLIAGRQRPQDAGERVLYEEDAGAMNLAPSVSPDGRYVAFFGRRDIFTVDLYVADARTGEIVKKLTSPNRSEHFDALSFIQSSGSWSPDGRKFAFIVFGEGDNQIAVMDIGSRDIERRFSVEGVGAVNTVAWSPDGRSIAFSGSAGGISDLYVLDMGSGSVRQITDDRYADLHPAWSPDSRTLAFVTDREGTDFDRLVYGQMQLGLIDVTSGSIRTLDIFAEGKHTNPQFSPNGQDIYFLADPQGFTDLYRLVLSSGEVYQVTKLATGISGITSLAPAMSVASQTGRIMFSVFENSGNNIYGIELSQAQGTLVDRSAPRVARAAVLPPVEAMGTDLVNTYLEDPTTGLPETRQFATRDYRSSIGLDFIAPPSVGVGANTQGNFGAAGGVAFFFSDMLGDHQIGAVAQANGSLKDLGGQAIYQNSEHRWNWGGMVGHVPYLTGQAFYDPSNGTYNQLLERIYVSQAMGMLKYPFTQTRRFDAAAGYTRYAFDRELITYLTDAFGQPIQDPIQQEQPSPDPLHFFESSVALVGDNSFFGLTSPVAGQRWRAEIAPTFGSLTYQTLTADYRRYFLLKPVTFAVRTLHYGRYGRDAEGRDSEGRMLLSPLFLGYETLVRGYAQESFSEQECISASTTAGCPAFDRLIGTRVGVFNIEMRIPLFGVEELGLINFPFIPIEIAPFFDGGLAWSADESPTFEFSRTNPGRIPVFSAGISARANILGYVILETYYAYPFQRPDKGAHFGFSLAPGW